MEGASVGQQAAYGLGSAAAGMLTEKLGNTGLQRSAYGSGWLDRESLGTLGRLAYSAVSEAGEEFAEGLADPLLKNLTYDPAAVYDDVWFSDTLYDSAVGATLGALGGGVDVETDTETDTQSLAEQENFIENEWEEDYTEYEGIDNSIGNVYGLTRQEEDSLVAYKSSESYKINAKLRESLDLDDYQRDVITGMDSALNKLPRYTGTVYRNIAFDDFGGEEAYNTFMSEHSEGNIVPYQAYTSTSTDKAGYPVEGKYKVHIEIIGSGRNVAGYGNNMEREILYPRNSLFLITKVETAEDGSPIIYMQEVVDD